VVVECRSTVPSLLVVVVVVVLLEAGGTDSTAGVDVSLTSRWYEKHPVRRPPTATVIKK
jgi:hypothetical protein